MVESWTSEPTRRTSSVTTYGRVAPSKRARRRMPGNPASQLAACRSASSARSTGSASGRTNEAFCQHCPVVQSIEARKYLGTMDRSRGGDERRGRLCAICVVLGNEKRIHMGTCALLFVYVG